MYTLYKGTTLNRRVILYSLQSILL